MKTLFNPKGITVSERNAELVALKASGKQVATDEHGRMIVDDMPATSVSGVAALKKALTSEPLPPGRRYCDGTECGFFSEAGIKINGCITYTADADGVEASKAAAAKTQAFISGGGPLAMNYVFFERAGKDVKDLDLGVMPRHREMIPAKHYERARKRYPERFRTPADKSNAVTSSPHVPSPGDKITGVYLGKPDLVAMANEGLLRNKFSNQF